MEKRELTCIGCPLGCSITVTLENGESTVVYLTGAEIDLGEEYAAQSADFKGSSTGEMLYLYDADKNVVDKVSVPALATDVSYGRDEGRTSFFYYDEATPGAANTTTASRTQPHHGNACVRVAGFMNCSSG